MFIVVFMIKIFLIIFSFIQKIEIDSHKLIIRYLLQL